LQEALEDIERFKDTAASYDSELRHCSASVKAKQSNIAHRVEVERSTIRDLTTKHNEYILQAKKSTKRVTDTGLPKEVRFVIYTQN
jgi:hypothetical protein